jgi:thiol-disulfide isomerase/thioredoxin
MRNFPMRTSLWICTLAVACAPLASTQDVQQLRAVIAANIPTITLDELGRKPPSPELVSASKAIVDAATQIYALPDVSAQNLQWTLQREAVALIVLGYAEPLTYYPRLTRISDELERRGLPTIVKETEKHVLELGGLLATRTGNNAVNLNIESLAERMVLYAKQYPGREATDIIERFLQRIRQMNARPRDSRLAIVAPIFQQYYQQINHTRRAEALDSDIFRATLPGQQMLLMGVDINGKDFELASVKDKVVLLQFWGTWCRHCKELMPELLALHEKYSAAGLEIIGINTGVQGDDERKVRQFIETPLPGGKTIPWTILVTSTSRRA